MRKLGTIMTMAAVGLALAACGQDAATLTAPETVRFDEAGGGTYGSLLEAEDGGGTYGSGGRSNDGGGTYGSGGAPSTAGVCPVEDERGGGTYGSGGRTGECPVTAPTL